LKLVTVLLPEAYLEGLDELVRANMYPSRSSVIRSSVRDLLKKELWEKRSGRAGGGLMVNLLCRKHLIFAAILLMG